MLLTKARGAAAASAALKAQKGPPYRRRVKNACHFLGKMTAAQRKGMGQRWMLSAWDGGQSESYEEEWSGSRMILDLK